ncbi:MAG: UDP-N-acetylmuramoyl-L-alanyl-D-glutamate--2,6-diaminopimelate ligase [Acidimicrobiaceae bacterium]|nr:UDP-N-acetylmuramoyl-L-alanyl-D-glutamate--2,6-diaminopimelate ligase [Acidimicrobiaceae bacterium]
MKRTSLAEIADQCPGALMVDATATDEIVKVTGVNHDSRSVAQGDLFACISGAEHDGHSYAIEAINGGAAALLVDRELNLAIPQIVVPDVRKAIGFASAAVYGHPSKQIKVIGITGTAGKTTVAQALAETLKACGESAGVIGTLEGSHTTPEAPEFQKKLSQMQSRGDEWVCVEVSSHGLEFGRVQGTEFAASVFTNLSPEHLDFHKDMEQYFLAKRRLFDQGSGLAVVSVADEWGKRLVRELQEIGHQGLVAVEPNMVEHPKLDVQRSSFVWRGHKIRTRLLGRFNLSNLLLVGETLKGLGLEEEMIASGLEKVQPVKGRMELVTDPGSEIAVIVDYSHKPEALAQALRTLRTISSGYVWVVFGAGGDRDPQKRPLMGQIAAELADEVVVTSDNPRSEDPSHIAQQIVSGMDERSTGPKVLLERAEAIQFAVNHAATGDSVLIAGKGHETYQITGSEQRPFDDTKVAQEALLKRVGTQHS